MSTTFSYHPTEIDTLEQSLSLERFNGYVQRANGDRTMAVRLYERNTRLSESLYGVVQGLEVCLRNSIDRVLRSACGPNWYDQPMALKYPLPEKLQSAKDSVLRQGKLLTPGRVVAELSFGFWTALIGRKYEKRLWVPYLHKAFPNAFFPVAHPGKKPAALDRPDIAERLETIRQLRNRIAHHEPILHYELESEHCKIVEATSWICPTSNFPERFAVASE